MKRKILVFDPNLCTGCMHCMTACSTYHEGSTSFSRARLQIIRHEGHAVTRIDEEDELIFSLSICQQCEDPICATVCPTCAIRRDGSTGAMTIERTKCVGCRMCMMTCYFGTISFSSEDGHAFKCDLCSGNPQCITFCQPQALRFLPIEQAPMPRRMRIANTLENNYGYAGRIRR